MEESRTIGLLTNTTRKLVMNGPELTAGSTPTFFNPTGINIPNSVVINIDKNKDVPTAIASAISL